MTVARSEQSRFAAATTALCFMAVVAWIIAPSDLMAGTAGRVPVDARPVGQWAAGPGMALQPSERVFSLAATKSLTTPTGTAASALTPGAMLSTV